LEGHFVTAMMAFFLMLWLLNIATEDQLNGIADYFTPTAASQSRSGSGGMLGGLAVAKRGSRQAPAGPPAITMTPLPPSTEEVQEDVEGKSGASEEDVEDQGGEAPGSIENSEELAARLEAERFEMATEALRQAIDAVPELQELAKSLLVDQTDQGLRIQLVDQERLAMFDLGSSQMQPHTRRLLEQVVKVIASLPNEISVTGHTDAAPYVTGLGYSNWELSTDRANSSRRTMIELGLPKERISDVSGRADRNLLVPQEPKSPRNRRISIVLLREGHANDLTDGPKALDASPQKPPRAEPATPPPTGATNPSRSTQEQGNPSSPGVAQLPPPRRQ
jgi:chemotaxis protein MotB